MAFKVSGKKTTDNIIEDPLYAMSHSLSFQDSLFLFVLAQFDYNMSWYEIL